MRWNWNSIHKACKWRNLGHQTVRLRDDGVAGMRKTVKLCRHCQKRMVSRPRSLCRTCYHDPKISPLYPTTSKYGRRSEAAAVSVGKEGQPTSELPGTLAKLQVLSARALAGEALWHERDAKIDDDTVIDQHLGQYYLPMRGPGAGPRSFKQTRTDQ